MTTPDMATQFAFMIAENAYQESIKSADRPPGYSVSRLGSGGEWSGSLVDACH